MLASAPFPVQLGKTYEMTVVADHATIYCSIDGKFAVMAQPDFSTHRSVGSGSSRAVRLAVDVAIPGLKSVTSSPVTPRMRRSRRFETGRPILDDVLVHMQPCPQGLRRLGRQSLAGRNPQGAEPANPVFYRGPYADWDEFAVRIQLFAPTVGGPATREQLINH